jgi:hypothetical protein
MKAARALLSGLCIAAMLAPLAFAHKVALKTGRVIQFESYQVTADLLLYTDSTGKKVKVALNDIDFDRTRELSASDKPPLDLPGLTPPATSGNSNIQPSLGEVARNLHIKGVTVASKRVLTNDDVASIPAVDSEPLPTQDSNPDTWRVRMNAVRATTTQFEDMTAVLLGRTVLGNLDVDFPNRRAWEEELFSRKEAVVTALQKASRQYEEFYHLRDTLKLTSKVSKGDEDKLTQARSTLETAINQAREQQSKFELVVDNGKQRAMEWKRK